MTSYAWQSVGEIDKLYQQAVKINSEWTGHPQQIMAAVELFKQWPHIRPFVSLPREIGAL